MARTKVLQEKVPSNESRRDGDDSVDPNDDTAMQPVVSIKGQDFGNKKVQQFMKTQEYMLKKRIKEHNLNNLIVGTEDELQREFENDDMQTDVVDARIEK